MPGTVPLSFGQSVRALETRAFRVLETRHPRGLVLPRHEHSHACVNLVLAGSYREDLPHTPQAFEALSCVYKPAGEPHENRFTDAPARALLIELRDETLVAPGLELERIVWTRAPLAARAGLALWRESGAEDGCSTLVVDQLGVELYDALLGRARAARVASARVREAAETLHDAPETSWTLSSLARHVGLHPAHLARAFRAAHGCTIGAYQRALRLNEVPRALALGTEGIAELALRLGFADQSHCTRAFRRFFGTTPGAYRRALARA